MAIDHIISPRLILKIVTENLILRKLIGKDFLTGLPNRAGFNERVKNTLAQAFRYRHPICIAMLDLDHFKKINDTYGHPIGDLVLKEIAKILKNSLRSNDLVARYGGEEFIIFLDLMPTKESEFPIEERARIPLERIRKSVAEKKIITPKGEISLTISIGYATYDFRNFSSHSIDQKKLLTKLIKIADDNLYRAKNSGRNRICPL